MCGRKIAFVMLILGILWQNGFAQGAPQGIYYQACARNYDGEELIHRDIGVRISILANSAAASAAEWVESHSVRTNAYGLFSIKIGNGTREPGSMKDEFSDIQWETATHYLKVEIDFGDGYRTMGATEFLSVPYALYAAYAGGYGNIGDTTGGDALQILSLEGNRLSISNGNAVTLDVNDADADAENEIQDLRVSQDSLYLTRNPEATKVDLSKYYDNTDNQNLELEGADLSISNGNTVDISQDLSYDNGMLSITNGNSVDIRTELVGFEAEKTTTSIISGADSIILQFDEIAEYPSGTADNYESGVFTVPAGAGGLYQFTVTYDFSNNQWLELKLVKLAGGSTFRAFSGESGNGPIVGYHTSTILYFLESGDKVSIRLVTDGLSTNGTGYFSGYKIR